MDQIYLCFAAGQWLKNTVLLLFMETTPEQKKLETLVTLMSKDQYKRLELIFQGKLRPSDFTEEEIKTLETKLYDEHQDATTIDKADLVWDIYKYRHDLCWRLVFRTILAVVAVSVAPYSNIELAKALCYWLVVLPALGLIINILAIRRMPTEFALWEKVKTGHIGLQKRLRIPETEDDKKNARPFKDDLMGYLYILLVLNLCNVLAIIFLWVPALKK